MHPRLFTLGGYTQHTYGLLVATAFVVGLGVAVWLARRERLDADRVFNLGVYVALVAFLGAKLLLVITDWDYYARNPRQVFSLQSLQAGGVFYGGFVAAVVFAVVYLRRAHLPFYKVADVFAPGVAAGHAVGRLGCFSAGCCYGKPTSLPWGITFTDSYAHDMFGTPLNVPLHPTQLYEAFAEALIFLLLLSRWKRRSFDGQILALYLAIYGAARFLIEFVRDDPDRGFLFNGRLSTSQFIAILMIVLAGAIWTWKRRYTVVPAAPQRAARKPKPA